MFFVFYYIDVTEEQQRAALAKGEKKISEYILAVLEHYKQKDPVGLPGAPIPDPLDIPQMKKTSLTFAEMHMQNVKLYGLSKFRIKHVKIDLATMRAEAALTMDILNVKGNYTLSTWLSRSAGPFTVKLTEVYVKAIARLEVERSGQLEAQEIDMDITFKDIDMNFERLGLLASAFQGVINSVGSFVFDSIKPFILSEANTNLRKDINKQAKTLPQKFPNSISPFDEIIADSRRRVRVMGCDPYRINDYNNTVGLFGIQMGHTWIKGLSSFHRVGDVIFELMNNTIHANIEVGTQKLEGTSHWEISLMGMMSRSGTVSFTVDYVKVSLRLLSYI